MANFVRDGIVMDIPEAQLALLKQGFDKADEAIIKLQKQLDSLDSFSVNDKKYLADAAVIAEIKAIQKAFDTYKAEYTIDQAQSDKLKAEITKLNKSVDELTAKEEALTKEMVAVQDRFSEEVVAERVIQRRKLERQVFPLLDCAEEKLEVLSDRQLKEALITDRYEHSPEDLSTRTDDAIDAMFEIACKHSIKDIAVNKKAGLHPVNQSSKSNNDAEKARQEYTEAIENAYKLAFK
jgi:cob(I)alamin adenosyltransferase